MSLDEFTKLCSLTGKVRRVYRHDCWHYVLNSNLKVPDPGSAKDAPLSTAIQFSNTRQDAHSPTDNRGKKTSTSVEEVLTSEVVKDFWESNFYIHKQHADISRCTEEYKVRTLLIEQHPTLASVKKKDLMRTLIRLTIEANLNVRRFKSATRVNHYNVLKKQREKPLSTATEVKFSLLNIRGMVLEDQNKSKFVKDNIVIPGNSANHIIMITESFLTPGHKDEEILFSFPEYTIKRCDRDTKIGRKTKQGGCFILTSPDISTCEIDSISNGVCEMIITEHPTLDLSIVTVYRPPDTTLAEFAEILQMIDKHLTSTKFTNSIIAGDFNFPPEVVTWVTTPEDGIVPVPTTCVSREDKIQLQNLLELVDKHLLQQIVNVPTRMDNTLDLLFTSCPDKFHTLKSTVMSPASDHNLITFNSDFTLDTEEDSKQQPSPKASNSMGDFNFSRANTAKLSEALEKKDLLKLVKEATDPITAKEALVEAFISCAEEAKVPKRKPSSYTSQSPEMRALFKSRNKISSKLRSKIPTYRHVELQQELRSIQEQIFELNQCEALNKETKVAEQIKVNPKAFYAHANKFRKTKTKIGPLKAGTEKVPEYIAGPQQMAEILSAQYQSVFSKPKTKLPQFNCKVFENPLLDINIKTESMVEALLSIGTWSASGPDEITPVFLKTFAVEIAPALCELWRKSLDTGIMPDDINLAFITPLFKGGDKGLPANYRPVALTNHITKAFEKIVKNELVIHLASHQFMNLTQHGFRAGRSTLTNLIEYYESVLLLLQHHPAVDAIYLDYSKAFDKCDHNIILEKLHDLGIRGKLNSWISGFLKRRQQIVVIQGAKSAPVWCTSGVPQGSVLGPILFLILMYDINREVTNAILSSFADDTKVWKGISTTRHEVLLQADLDLIYRWAADNNMKFNSKKFQGIRFSNSASSCTYQNDVGDPINQTDVVKDLGVLISFDLSFDQHIRAIANKGKQMAGWIRRTFFTRSRGVMLTLLKQLIYPSMEYNSILWSPSSPELISLIESVQNNFLRIICSPDTPNNMDYWDRLAHYKLYSMERRRERYSIIYAWKVIHGLYPNPGVHLNQSTPDHQMHPNQGIQINLHQRDDMTAHHEVSPDSPAWLKGKSVLQASCQLFNLLPQELRRSLGDDEEPCLETFKSQLDEWLTHIPDQPTVAGRFRPARTNSIVHQYEYRSAYTPRPRAAHRTKTSNNGKSKDGNSRSKRKNGYGKLTDELLQKMRKNASEWDYWR